MTKLGKKKTLKIILENEIKFQIFFSDVAQNDVVLLYVILSWVGT